MLKWKDEEAVQVYGSFVWLDNCELSSESYSIFGKMLN